MLLALVLADAEADVLALADGVALWPSEADKLWLSETLALSDAEVLAERLPLAEAEAL
ncbi:hypothetical protein LHA01_22460 [Schleiferilactobacillus harbinensis]|nr:hypothetical protein LHA01_22460 [Schleiferilactobacillus harbinensis]